MSKWYVTYSDEDLMHHGVKGMKWGVRNEPVARGVRGYTSSVNVKKTGSGHKHSSGGTYKPSNINKSGGNPVDRVGEYGGALLTAGATPDDLYKLAQYFDIINSGGKLTDEQMEYIISTMNKMGEEKLKKYMKEVPAYQRLVSTYMRNKNTRTSSSSSSSSSSTSTRHHIGAENLGNLRDRSNGNRSPNRISTTVEGPYTTQRDRIGRNQHSRGNGGRF